ncbi:MAG TPA: DUF6062 family protein [Defluviitaleaceae bacterium]|nr:ABC transporter substrate-binding protein [Candidatus Epulonipiscium sp.]HOA80789.1 DUF6062 family protein [Defluviitaleaceae bacterium]
MKEKIYTIPVIDAFKEVTECPICNLYKKLEDDSIDFMLGPSYMEDDIRMETNKIGFCPHHYEKMFEEKNRLGLALMIHTHLQEINKKLSKVISSNKDFNVKTKSLFSMIKTSKNNTSNENNNPISSYINNVYNSCYICNRIEKTFNRYVDTFFYLWKNDENFVSLVSEGKGFCLSHFSLLLERASSALNKNQYNHFTQIVIPIQLENLKRIEDEIDWFIQKFDYRFKDEPWKNSKDAIQRSILKIASKQIKIEDC